MCDSGVHPAFSGMAALPFLDELDWSTVDAILITHFHLDHAASLTYVMEKVSLSQQLRTHQSRTMVNPVCIHSD